MNSDGKYVRLKDPKRKVGDASLEETIFPQDFSPSKRHQAAVGKEDDDLQCRICNFVMDSLESKNKHVKLVHPQQRNMKKTNEVDSKKSKSKNVAAADCTFECKVCETYFSTMEKLKAHNSEKHPKLKPKTAAVKSVKIPIQKQKHVCEECDQILDSKTQLKKHKSAEHPKNSKKQPQLKTKPKPSNPSKQPPGPPGPSVSSTNIVNNSTASEEYYCDECGLEYHSRATYKNHMESMHEEDISNSPKKLQVMEPQSSAAFDNDDEDDENQGDEYLLDEDVVGDIGETIFMDGYEVAEKVITANGDFGIDEISSRIMKTKISPSFLKNKNLELMEEDISDDDDDVVPMEDSSDSEKDIVLDSPKTPEEITLGDDDDDEEEDEIIPDPSTEEIKHIKVYENFLTRDPDYVLNVVDNEDNMKKLWKGLWWSQPKAWKPASPWETWNATVKQICAFYRIKDVPLEQGRTFKSYEQFDEEVGPEIKAMNPNKGFVALYKWKKTKWLETLDPVIPDNMKFVEESVDDDED